MVNPRHDIAFEEAIEISAADLVRWLRGGEEALVAAGETAQLTKLWEL